MEGLEISEVPFSEAVDINRIDSEYFRPSLIRLEQKIGSKPFSNLGEVTDFLIGPFGSAFDTDNYTTNDVSNRRYIRGKDVKTFFLEESDNVYIPEADFQRLSKYAIKEHDILISVVGTLGNACIAQKSDIPAIFSCKSTVLRNSTVNPWFLTTYFNSPTGKQLLLRNARGAVQLGLNLVDLQRLKIPIFGKSLISKIERTVGAAKATLQTSKSYFQQAEQELLAALDLESWHPPTPLTYEASANEAFQSDRLDAEFFQPRIKELYQLLGNKSQCIRDVSDLRQDRFNGTKSQFNYLEIGAVSSDGIIADSIIDGDEAPSRATWHVERGDVLTSTVRPIRGLTAIIEDSQHGSVASSGFAVLTPKGISPELLLCYLKLPQICELMDLHTSASMYPAISVSDILGLPFKNPGKEAEEKIISLIQEARAKRANSKSLLERAKRAVEIAIEESEETALAYLDGKHYLADELLPKLFSPNRHYIDLATVQRTIEAEALVYEDATINRYLHQWTRDGRIHDAGRGWYSDLPHAFQPVLETPPLPELERLLKRKFPLLEFTVWSTRQFTTFFHHYAARHATFLMVDRDAMDTVADVLSKAGHHVVIHPLGEAAKNFALTQDETIILRPRLSSDHNETYAPIEQMLVDLHHEIQKLGLFDLAEFQSVFENLANRYRLNIPALKRYAERRKIDSTELLKLGGII